ncbi:uncharacterized protein MELLADRAFT_104578 [Melampsora larici-populina 98AG31]|uniref:Uncharacterized protein n=1 Tax=Melampsora larici-populina (strain 98AG31 / pathotype 3-4-7) TaxID=747676 RepID=F4RF71_MELLP|nr:uncharacterized protein MELLADRAFT_104578 [Melampsora larici-populina 98AG31]EGG08985.1 hypothetical protein MELLADRAFT_104578 [Melampsora larici-populina 98AG31]
MSLYVLPKQPPITGTSLTMPPLKHLSTSMVRGFGLVRWADLSLKTHAVPDWMIAQYIVMYIEESQALPMPKQQDRIITLDDWETPVYLNIALPLDGDPEVVIVEN